MLPSFLKAITSSMSEQSVIKVSFLSPMPKAFLEICIEFYIIGCNMFNLNRFEALQFRSSNFFTSVGLFDALKIGYGVVVRWARWFLTSASFSSKPWMISSALKLSNFEIRLILISVSLRMSSSVMSLIRLKAEALLLMRDGVDTWLCMPFVNRGNNSFPCFALLNISINSFSIKIFSKEAKCHFCSSCSFSISNSH